MSKFTNISEPAKNALMTIGVESGKDLSVIDYENLGKLEGITEQDLFIINEEFNLKEPEADMPYTDFAVIGDLKCNNAPKRRYVRDLMIAMCTRDEELLKNVVADEVLGQVVNADIIVKPEDLFDVVPFVARDIVLLNIYTMLSHGAEGAGHCVVRDKEDIVELGVFVEFQNHKKDAKISQVKIFRV